MLGSRGMQTPPALAPPRGGFVSQFSPGGAVGSFRSFPARCPGEVSPFWKTELGFVSQIGGEGRWVRFVVPDAVRDDHRVVKESGGANALGEEYRGPGPRRSANLQPGDHRRARSRNREPHPLGKKCSEFLILPH